MPYRSPFFLHPVAGRGGAGGLFADVWGGVGVGVCGGGGSLHAFRPSEVRNFEDAYVTKTISEDGNFAR